MIQYKKLNKLKLQKQIRKLLILIETVAYMTKME